MPRLTLALLIGPVLAGLAGTLVPALRDAGAGFAALAGWPGLGAALRLSLVSGLGSTVLALAVALLIVAMLQNSRVFGLLRHLLSPLLAVPHAAAALGLAFLIAPSGWLVRLLSPWATGWQDPPDLLILNDPAGLALLLGLTAKELPFLLLMSLAALPQTDAPRRMLLAAGLGYGRGWGFALTVLPALYRQLRLPVYAVLAYAMTAVDMGLILGPSLPPPLSVQIARWMTDPGLAQRGIAAAGATLQLAAVLAALTLWHLAERLARAGLTAAALRGWRGRALDRPLRLAALLCGGGLAALSIAGLAGLVLWSFATQWPFPADLPQGWSLQTWRQAAPALWATGLRSLWIAVLATAASLVLVLGCLEAEHRLGLTPGQRALWLLYLPLLVPQIAFLPGLQTFALIAGAEGALLPVAAAHLVFVLPYVFLSLAPPYRAWDSRHALIGAALGAGPDRVFWRLRLPMLLPALLTAFALGLAVSVGQYLPSLLIGGGRVTTLTTEAVALASGGNRRIIGAYALLQMLLPAAGFALALALPRLLFRHRRGMVAEARA